MITFTKLVVSLTIILSCAQGQNLGPGKPCSANTECKGYPEAASCDAAAGVCWCLDGYAPLIPPNGGPEDVECFKILNQLGDACIIPGQCQVGIPGPHSNCLDSEANPGTYVCTCNPDAINEPGFHECHLKVIEVGKECEGDDQCRANFGEHSFCDTNEDPKVCACDSAESLVSDDKKECLPFRDQIGDSCKQPEQCQSAGEFSDCIESMCSCKDEAINKPGEYKCLKKADKIDDPCEHVVQCSSNLGELSECFQNTNCQCLAPPVAVASQENDFCLPIRQEIGDECEEDQQCEAGSPGQWSECALENGGVTGTCNCDEDGIQDPDDGNDHECYQKANKLGDGCEFNAQCESNLLESECGVDKTCTCKAGFVPGTGETFCFKGGILIGEPCNDTIQCVGKPDLTSECATTCQCKHDYVARGDRGDCLAVVNELGKECEESQQCQSGDPGQLSDCLENTEIPPKKVCTCSEAAIGVNNKCYRKATLVGDPCEVNPQCSINLVLSSCYNKFCECYGNSVPASDNRRCLSTSLLGEVCVDEQQCSAHIPNSSCEIDSEDPAKKKCACDEGYVHPVHVNNKCYQLAEFVGDSCANHTMQCDELEDVHCNTVKPSPTCDCVDTTDVISESRKRCLDAVEALHEGCEESVQCQVENSECLLEPSTDKDECQCKKDEFVEAETPENAGTCLEIRENVNLTCAEHIQCSSGMGENAECLNEMCHCKSSFVFYNGTCLQAVPLGGVCQTGLPASDLQCQAGVNNVWAECRGGTCKCRPGAIEVEESCWGDKKVGDLCESTKECTVSILGPVRCDTTTDLCVCEADHVSEGDGKICSSANMSVKWQFNILLMLVVVVGLSNY